MRVSKSASRNCRRFRGRSMGSRGISSNYYRDCRSNTELRIQGTKWRCCMSNSLPKPSGRLLTRQHYCPHRKHLRRTPPNRGSKRRLHIRPRKKHLGCRLADKSSCRQSLRHTQLHDNCGCGSDYCGGLHYYREGGGLGWEWAGVDEGGEEGEEDGVEMHCVCLAAVWLGSAWRY